MSLKKRVFIADDDEAVLTSLQRLLQLSDFEVEVTRHPKEIVDKIKAFRPDIILLDLLMPNLGGLEICEMLNSDDQTQGIPIIVISALGREEDIKRAYRLGVIGYFVKPYDFNDLLKEIRRTIAYKEAKPE
ncbi:MAG: response regulator [Candidatus Omnitrophota bacterium]